MTKLSSIPDLEEAERIEIEDSILHNCYFEAVEDEVELCDVHDECRLFVFNENHIEVLKAVTQYLEKRKRRGTINA